MFKGKLYPQKKWLILGLSCLLLPLYQNMTPFEEGQAVDIRQYAPARPAGYLENPIAAYVPGRLSGNSLSEVGESLLGHNFDPMLKRTEFLGVSLFEGSHSYAGEMHGQGAYFDEYRSPSSLRLDVVGPSQVRLSYRVGSYKGSQGGFSMSCQADARSGLLVQMNQPLSSKIHLGISHETAARLSQVKMGIDW